MATKCKMKKPQTVGAVAGECHNRLSTGDEEKIAQLLAGASPADVEEMLSEAKARNASALGMATKRMDDLCKCLRQLMGGHFSGLIIRKESMADVVSNLCADVATPPASFVQDCKDHLRRLRTEVE